MSGAWFDSSPRNPDFIQPKEKCRNCGARVGTDVPTPERCGNCPPWTCDQCGRPCSMTKPCGCWISLEGMPLADLKALFADDCDGPGINLTVVGVRNPNACPRRSMHGTGPRNCQACSWKETP